MNDFLTEAIRIGDQLLEQAESDEHGLSWSTTSFYDTGTYSLAKYENMYSGNAGIILFLIELYRQTQKKTYLEAAEKAMHWLFAYCHSKPTNNYAFFTGRMGVSFTCLKLYEVTKNKKYASQALSLAKPCLTILDEDVSHDLVNGYVGTLLGLIYLHSKTNEEWVLDYIAKFTAKLISNARYGKAGLYWDSDFSQVRPLCGFSHGSSGIGFVFLELAHYLNNPAFNYIAEQAFVYENVYFNRKMNNWPDFRIQIFDEQSVRSYEKHFNEGTIAAFTKQTDTCQWCHGAPGIGLARLRWFDLSQNHIALSDTNHALRKAKKRHNDTFTYCHGAAGHAELFLEGFTTLHDSKLLHFATNIGNEALLQKRTFNKYQTDFSLDNAALPEEFSLFNGLSGIGYFYLRLANPQNVPSILAPKLQETIKASQLPEELQLKPADIRRKLAGNHYGRTLAKLELFVPDKVHEYFLESQINHSEIENFGAYLKKLIAALPKSQHEEMNALFNFEQRKIALVSDNISNGYVFIKNRVDTKQSMDLNKLPDSVLATLRFVLSPQHDTANLKMIHSSYLLKLTPNGVQELAVSEFCELVLSSFTKPKTGNEVIFNLYKKLGAQSTEDQMRVKEAAIAQIREALRYGILTRDQQK